jgi:acetyltransferase-like isoleucine patch superfamily enzyme
MTMAGVPPGVVVLGDGEVSVGAGVSFGTGVKLEGNVTVGAGTRIGDRVTLCDVQLGDRCIVESETILGYRQSTGRFSDNDGGETSRKKIEMAIVGAGTLIRNQVTVYHGAVIGPGCWVNHGAIVREGSRIGAGTSIGIQTYIDRDVSIGERCLVHNQCQVAAGTILEDCVFVGPNVTMTNNSPIAYLRNLSGTIRGPVLRFGCAIGGGATLNPGVVVGAETIVASGSTVIADTGDAVVVGGIPAEKLRDLPRRWRIREDVRREYASAPRLRGNDD